MVLGKPASRGVRLFLALLFVFATTAALLAAAHRSALASSACTPSVSQAKEGTETVVEWTYSISNAGRARRRT